MVSNKAQPNNHPIYSVETEIGSSIFFNDLSFEDKVPDTDMTAKDKSDQQTEKISEQQDNAENEMWNMSFDGAVSREGAGVGVWINPPDWPQNFVLISFLLSAQIIWLNMRH
jgi:hypothetical protein